MLRAAGYFEPCLRYSFGRVPLVHSLISFLAKLKISAHHCAKSSSTTPEFFCTRNDLVLSEARFAAFDPPVVCESTRLSALTCKIGRNILWYIPQRLSDLMDIVTVEAGVRKIDLDKYAEPQKLIKYKVVCNLL